MFDKESNTKGVAWTPGSGPDLEAILRLTKQFRAPGQPMGEA
jgi:hypothetical protein